MVAGASRSKVATRAKRSQNCELVVHDRPALEAYLPGWIISIDILEYIFTKKNINSKIIRQEAFVSSQQADIFVLGATKDSTTSHGTKAATPSTNYRSIVRAKAELCRPYCSHSLYATPRLLIQTHP